MLNRWSDAKSVTISSVSDDIAEDTAALSITHAISSTDTAYNTAAVFTPSNVLSLSLYDDDGAVILVSKSQVLLTEGEATVYTGTPAR